ncbi:MAG: DUF5694 domain-containing protein [Bacteroidota bacterium]
MKALIFIISLLLVSNLFAQNQKEVYIIGTMHTVPKIVKNSYKPLLKKAKSYNPEAIYVETVRPEDTLSMQNDSPEFIHLSDSMSTVFKIEETKFNRLMNKDLQAMEIEDFEYLERCFLIKKDYANYSYYGYLKRHGLEGSPEPTRDENGDLTAKLAIAQNMKYIYAMDDQKERLKYHEAWSTCATEGRENGNEEASNKLVKKLMTKGIVSGLSGYLGKQTNSAKSIEQMHRLNSFEYVTVATEACSDGNRYWDNRNYAMVKNIAEQVQAMPHQRNIVVVGAGHVYGMKEAFKKYYPDIKVILMSDKQQMQAKKNTQALAQN